MLRTIGLLISIGSCIAFLAGCAATPSPTNLSRAPGTTFKDCADCPRMTVIPAGSFTMGSPDSEEGHSKNEGPQHQVTISRAFAIGAYNVTRAEYAAFVRETKRPSGGCSVYTGTGFAKDASKDWRDPGYRQTDRDPVVCVSWEDAQAYAKWLNSRVRKASSGANTGPYRLVTDAEWEYAARAGTTTPYYWGDNADSICGHGNVADLSGKQAIPSWATRAVANCTDGYAYTAPVGSFPPNGFGLYDMGGNAWQWTEDCGHDNYDGAPTDGTAWTTGECKTRIVRGADWHREPRAARAASHIGSRPGDPYGSVGFRVARTLD